MTIQPGAPLRNPPARRAQPPGPQGWPLLGAGPRQCSGNNFALMEAQLILALIEQRYRLTLAPDHPIVPQPVVTLRPQYGSDMNLKSR